MLEVSEAIGASMTMAMTLECRTCSHIYEVTLADIRDGTWQRRGCPVCSVERTDANRPARPATSDRG